MFDVSSKVCLLGRLGKCMKGSTGLLQEGQDKKKDKTRKRTRRNISGGKICSVIVLLVSSNLTLHVWINRIEWGKILNLYIKFSRMDPSETASSSYTKQRNYYEKKGDSKYCFLWWSVFFGWLRKPWPLCEECIYSYDLIEFPPLLLCSYQSLGCNIFFLTYCSNPNRQ